jgi:hypothetical protein
MTGRPEPNESAPYYLTYIDKVSSGNIIAAMEIQMEETLALAYILAGHVNRHTAILRERYL